MKIQKLNILQEITTFNRIDLLNKYQLRNEEKEILNVMINKFNQYIKGLRKKLLKYCNYTQDELCSDLFLTYPMIAYS